MLCYVFVALITVLQTVQKHGVYSAVHDTVRANMRHWPNVDLLLAHRLRRWPNSKPTLGQRLMFAGVQYKEPLKAFGKSWVFILSRYCHECPESDAKQYSPIFALIECHRTLFAAHGTPGPKVPKRRTQMRNSIGQDCHLNKSPA